MPDKNLQLSYADQEYLLEGVGESVYPRVAPAANGAAATTQSLRLVGMLCKRTEPISNIAFSTGTTAAGATPTLVRYGLWERSPLRESYSLVASTVSDLTLLVAANTRYPKATSAPYTKQQGQEYLVGCLVVSAAAMPTFQQYSTAIYTGFAAQLLLPPVRTAQLAAQADLPAIITVSALTISNNSYICDLF